MNNMNSTAQLFLGFPINALFAEKLATIPSQILKLSICDLQEIEDKGTKYLGKYVENCIELSTLQLLEANIYSLLKRIHPEYPYATTPLVILATLQ